MVCCRNHWLTLPRTFEHMHCTSLKGYTSAGYPKASLGNRYVKMPFLYITDQHKHRGAHLLVAKFISGRLYLVRTVRWELCPSWH